MKKINEDIGRGEIYLDQNDEIDVIGEEQKDREDTEISQQPVQAHFQEKQ